VIPQGDEYVGRYEEAIEQLSESDPLNAFDLRTKAQIPRFVTTLKSMAVLQGTTDVDMALMEKYLKGMLVPQLEIAIKELAKLHGKSTLRQVNGMLSKPIEMPSELNEFLQDVQAANAKTQENPPLT
jgi:hypothetical protein